MLDDVHASSATDRLPVPPSRPATTLADVRPGDTMRVRAVPAWVRETLAGLGLVEGAYVRCESVDRYVVVRTADGTVPFERGLVSAVEVDVLDPPADLRTGEWPAPSRPDAPNARDAH
ncbi:ferrous iron transport protein A [Roseisolibacter sp. H3M3-2]|uniref:ferrous iron transport protein A n=1 Tax=Roseisolibacter sp. H3M3-2 TaxID=3031323 RepID=UPI0023DC7F9F|nr:ferrous iron transport protein A [Roseisolibacter sp. H3M3-2]MDF1505320.1 ferrous iron transport protein A [Roseisolibacter sp. H3M3-2]